MQKTLVKVMHRKIVFVKVESSVIEISKRYTGVQMFYFLNNFGFNSQQYSTCFLVFLIVHTV